MAKAKSVRQLIACGNIATNFNGVIGQHMIKFVDDQSFKEGAVVANPGYGGDTTYYTIDKGSGKVWHLKQAIRSPLNYTGVYTSDTGSGRVRGGSGNPAGKIVLDAKHFIYVSHLDDAGNPDLYVYLDTLFPEKGVHPFTKDRCYGSAYASDDGAGAGVFVTSLGLRLQSIDGGLPLVDA